MTGEELYELYCDSLSDLQSCGADDWDDLSDDDQEVWCDVAAKIEDLQNANG